MSEKVLCEKSDLVAIADAVREATGSTENYNVSELSVATVEAISAGSLGGSIETCTVTVNGADNCYYTTYIDDAYGYAESSGTILNNVACNTIFFVIMDSAGIAPMVTTSGSIEQLGTIVNECAYILILRATSSAGGSVTLTPYCCFVAGTQVLISLDGDTKNIEDITIDNTIVSYNIETGENYLTEVTKIITKENTTDIAEITFDNGIVIKMNAYHPLYCEDGFHSITRYNNYNELIIGDNVKTSEGWSKVININRYISEPIITYNLDVRNVEEDPDVDTNDTYYANGIVVKNGAC